ncbi:MAG TPA: hypothetical protein ENN10_01215 [Actinobacteria bacterium]|nr:hypothetical protein [Actinomycetota bacterium]
MRPPRRPASHAAGRPAASPGRPRERNRSRPSRRTAASTRRPLSAHGCRARERVRWPPASTAGPSGASCPRRRPSQLRSMRPRGGTTTGPR